jgi:predicted TIM-barrel fold metal-dependent hydrolase
VEHALIVDCDAHVMEPADLWQRYLEPRFRSRAIRIEIVDGIEQLIVGEQVVLSARLAGLGGAHLDRARIFAGEYTYRDGCPPASYDPTARVALLDQWGVDVAVLFPTIGILPFPEQDRDLASAYCRAYNTWQMEFSQSIPGRVAPIAAVNWHDPAAAEVELDRCLAAGFRGLFVPPETIAGARPGAAQFDGIWQRCAAAGVPGCLHVIVRFGGAAVPFAAWQATAPGPIFSFGLGGTGQLLPALTSLIIDGVFDRFPTLKIVSVEAGCGFAGYLMDRLDAKHRFFGAFTDLALKPSEYVRRNCYFVAEPEERTIGAMLDLVGEDRIFWGSDYPHIDATLDAPKLIRSSVSGLSPERQRAVMGDNAARVFALG